MSNDDIVTFALQGLSAKFDQVAGIISNQEPFPDLATVHNMVRTEEMRLKARSQTSTIDSSSSSPMVLLVESTNNSRRGMVMTTLFHHNYVVDGTLSHYKARLVANGSTQLEGIDVDETCSPVVKLGTTRTVLSLATSWQWLVHQLDAKNAFLHGDLSKAIYMHQPPVFWDSAHPDYASGHISFPSTNNSAENSSHPRQQQQCHEDSVSLVQESKTSLELFRLLTKSTQRVRTSAFKLSRISHMQSISKKPKEERCCRFGKRLDIEAPGNGNGSE
ncbi:ribonuclease H-like domain-containing protein [Tanacetum coccineum]